MLQCAPNAHRGALFTESAGQALFGGVVGERGCAGRGDSCTEHGAGQHTPAPRATPESFRCPPALGLGNSGPEKKDPQMNEETRPEASALTHTWFGLWFAQAPCPPAAMSCGQSQQQCRPPPKCPPKSPAQCLPPASSSCAPGSRGSCGLSSGGDCCLGHLRHHGSHGCRRHSSSSCDGGSALQSGGSGCGHGSVGGC